MAYQSHTNAPLAFGPGLLATRVEAALERLGDHMLYRRTLNELMALGAHELADLGLNRSMLRSTAYEAVYGRR